MLLRNFPLLELLCVEILAFRPRSLASFLNLCFENYLEVFVCLGGDNRMDTVIR